MPRFTQPQAIEPYLSDASQFSGHADEVILPENEKEISELLKEADAKKIPVTVSAGRTGLTGAAVPLGGWVLSTEKLGKILKIQKTKTEAWARLEPAIFLKDLDHTLEPEKLFYPPDPTGPKAFLGGTVGTNASGPKSFKYGPTRPYVRRIRVVLADGEILDLARGQIVANPEGVLQIPLTHRTLKVPLPHYSWPAVKHAGGYFASPRMDAVDLFIGSEGTLGVVTEIEVTLLPRPSEVIAFVVFFRSEEDSWRFAKSAREKKAGLEARVLEYFDQGSLEFLRPGFPSLPKEARACLFIEQEVQPQTKPRALEGWRRLFEKEGTLEEIWEGETPRQQEEFRNFRSALPLAVRDFLAQHHQRKVGTDTCVPHEHFEELVLFHRRVIERLGLRNVTFGHIGESHVHLNLLPQDEEEAGRARLLYPTLVKQALSLGGTFSAEHGVGKLKRSYFRDFFGEAAVREMLEIKRIFDPNLILGRGNLFEIK